jgi:hypothetical protein
MPSVCFPRESQAYLPLHARSPNHFVVSQDTRFGVGRVEHLLQVTSGRLDDLDDGRVALFAPLFDLRWLMGGEMIFSSTTIQDA